jgi:adenosylcobyric acid synthase
MAADLTNMAVARLARAPVLLVGDIDRGGVFASFVGSLAVLAPRDRRRVRGFLINRFRGERALLIPALEFLTRRTRRPVLGVVPFLPGLHLPEEDSVALDEPARVEASRPLVAVVRLPYIANFADFAPLAADPAIELRYVRRPEELARCALAILPGSKDTLADLRWLRETGFADALADHAARGGRLGGICGGFQMLGRLVADPDGVEGGGAAEGLGCLPVETVLARGKVTRRVRARLAGAPERFEAYELHMGRTRAVGPVAPFAVVDGADGARPEGAATADGRVWGTYLHGLFDSAAVRRALLAGLDAPASTSPVAIDYRALREREYVRLAAHVREHVDLSAVLALAGMR